MDMLKHERVFIDLKKLFLPVSYTIMIKEQKKKADYSCLAASYTEKPFSRGAYSLINIYRTRTNNSLHQSYMNIVVEVTNLHTQNCKTKLIKCKQHTIIHPPH